MKYHYVYQVTLSSTGEFYIGVRTSSVSPLKDPYKGSMKSWKVDKNLLTKEILGVYPTRLEANAAEQIKIKTYIENTLNRNAHIPSEEKKKEMSKAAKLRYYNKLKEYTLENGGPCLYVVWLEQQILEIELL
jgi:hypothetical protein